MGKGKESAAASGAMSGAMMGSAVPGIGTVAGGLLGGALGYFGGADDNSSEEYDKMMQRLDGVNIPGIDQLTFTPEELQYLGDFTPEELQAYALQKSEMENINRDPRLRQEQMKALDQVSQLADRGFSDEDMMAFNVARQQAAGEAEAKQGQILQNMQQRGQGGSGAELIARLTSSQNSANQLSLEQQKQAIAQAEARKQALNMLANQAGSLRSQDFGEESAIASASDLVNRINQQNQQNVSNTNVGNRNQARSGNLTRRQNMSDSNVDIRNRGKASNINAIKDRFGMEMEKATGQNRVGGYQADNSARQAGNTNAGIGQIGQGLVGLAGTYNSKPQVGTQDWNAGEEDALNALTQDDPYTPAPTRRSGLIPR